MLFNTFLTTLFSFFFGSDIDGILLGHSLLKASDCFAEAEADFRKFSDAKNNEDNHEENQKFGHSESKHKSPWVKQVKRSVYEGQALQPIRMKSP